MHCLTISLASAGLGTVLGEQKPIGCSPTPALVNAPAGDVFALITDIERLLERNAGIRHDQANGAWRRWEEEEVLARS